jgi:hypothetical protein
MSKNFWTPEKIALLGTISDCAIAKRLGISPASVWQRREKLGILPFRLSKTKWGQSELALFRGYSDSKIAKMTGRSVKEVAAKRRSL